MADQPTDQSCANCYYFISGLCRRDPPQVISATLVRWPPVDAGDWCGDWFLMATPIPPQENSDDE